MTSAVVDETYHLLRDAFIVEPVDEDSAPES